MIKTVGVSGYFSTGSSAIVDLLHEFDETQILDFEFRVTRVPDGLEDLEYNLRNPHSSPIAIKRFRKIMTEKSVAGAVTKKEMEKIVDEFLNQIIQFSWSSYRNVMLDMYLQSLRARYLRRFVRRVFNKLHLRKPIDKIMDKLFSYKIDLSIAPEEFDEASRHFISEILKAMGINYNDKKKEVIVINQAFWACDPIRSFKYFENPVSIIVDRDPRDQYLFNKFFLYPRGSRLLVPFDNVDDYIKHFRLLRRSSQDLRKQKNIMFFNFEELVYDCENAVKKLADFIGVEKRSQKGEFFKPTHSRNNTQLFKKYSGCEADIKKIERELSEYIFPFENYPDIEPDGGMFWGSQINKSR